MNGRRWGILAVFVLSTAINYLDRQTLATLAPLLRAEFHLSNTQYGLILTAFSLTYMAAAPFAGMMIDRFGLNRAISAAVAVWSCAGMATGLTRGLPGLVACRAVLGASEAAGIPAAGKAIHAYLKPAERALGNAVNQAGVSLGLMLAPPVATWLAVRYGWRQAFLLTGLLGLAWIPVWNRVGRGSPEAQARTPVSLDLLRSPRMWGSGRRQRSQHGPLFAVDQLDHPVPGRDPSPHAGASRVVRLDSPALRHPGRVRRRLGFAARG